MQPRRPIGVAILAILTIIIGIFTLLGGLVLMGLGGLGFAVGAGVFGALTAAIGAVIFLFGVVGVVAGWGLWRLRPWAWWLAIIVGVIQVIVGGIGLDYISLGLWLIILVYLIAVRRSFTTARPVGM